MAGIGNKIASAIPGTQAHEEHHSSKKSSSSEEHHSSTTSGAPVGGTTGAPQVGGTTGVPQNSGLPQSTTTGAPQANTTGTTPVVGNPHSGVSTPGNTGVSSTTTVPTNAAGNRVPSGSTY